MRKETEKKTKRKKREGGWARGGRRLTEEEGDKPGPES